MNLKSINSEKMYDGDWKRKKMFMGMVLIIFGLIWYLNDTGAIYLEPFWPIMVILAGLLLVFKASLMSSTAKKRR